MGSSSSRCCVRKAIFTVIPVVSFPAAGANSLARTRIKVLLPAPLIPTMPIRSPGPIFHVKRERSSLSPALTCISFVSRTVLPKRLSANLRSSLPSRGAGSAEINSFAASTRNFGFVVRAGAPRRSQASSFLIKLLRRASVAADWRERSAFARTNAE